MRKTVRLIGYVDIGINKNFEYIQMFLKNVTVRLTEKHWTRQDDSKDRAYGTAELSRWVPAC